ncbi:uncharacterized protein METZ01_LOCUS313209 [marine metagenome]|uniref:PsbP C-terminal domain-containing protein n=1 Tax=marine metagenome TaxID=408172 RepID=A0A382NJ77_9ZZZZ
MPVKRFRMWLPVCLGTILLWVASCADSSKISSYSIPKEKQSSLANDNPEMAQPIWEIPSGWKPGKESAMRVGSFAVEDENGSALDISISNLLGDGGGLLSNVNRWIGQIGMSATTGEGLSNYVSDITIAGKSATLVKASNKEQTLVAAILKTGGRSWFFKMIGESRLAEKEQANFDSLLQSVRFESSEGE